MATAAVAVVARLPGGGTCFFCSLVFGETGRTKFKENNTINSKTSPMLAGVGFGSGALLACASVSGTAILWNLPFGNDE